MITEKKLHKIIMESINKILNEESINGRYQVYVEGDMKDVLIDDRIPMVRIDDYTIDGKQAINAIKQIKGFLDYSNDGIESAIEQYLFDELK